MRAAINRILKQPNLIGINTSKPTETAYIGDPVAVRRPTDAHIHLKVQWSKIIAGGNAHALIYSTWVQE